MNKEEVDKGKNAMTVEDFNRKAEELYKKLGRYETLLLAGELARMMAFLDNTFAPDDPTGLYDTLHLKFGMCVVSLGRIYPDLLKEIGLLKDD